MRFVAFQPGRRCGSGHDEADLILERVGRNEERRGVRRR